MNQATTPVQTSASRHGGQLDWFRESNPREWQVSSPYYEQLQPENDNKIAGHSLHARAVLLKYMSGLVNNIKLLLYSRISGESDEQHFLRVAHQLAGAVENAGLSDEQIARVTESLKTKAPKERQLPPSPPQTWEEAEGCGVRKWADAKAAGLTIIDHLRDEKHGYGRWTLREPGLNRSLLMKLDEPAYRALYTFLKAEPLPTALKLPKQRDVTDRLVAMSEAPGSRPAHIDWAMRARARYERSKLSR